MRRISLAIAFFVGCAIGVLGMSLWGFSKSGNQDAATDVLAKSVYYGSEVEARHALFEIMRDERWEILMNAFVEMGPDVRAPISSSNKIFILESIEYHPAFRDLVRVIALAASQEDGRIVRSKAVDMLRMFKRDGWGAGMQIIENTMAKEADRELRQKKEDLVSRL